jgi:hypothetical protein
VRIPLFGGIAVAVLLLGAVGAFGQPSGQTGGQSNPAGAQGASSSFAIQIANRLASINDLYLKLKEPAAHYVKDNYDITKRMQQECNAAEDVFTWRVTPAEASQVLNEIVRIHMLMACAAVFVDDNMLFDKHTEIANRRVRQYRGFAGGTSNATVTSLIGGHSIKPGLSLQQEYERLSAQHIASRNARPEISLTIDRSTNLNPLRDFAIEALPDRGSAEPVDDARLFAENLNSRLAEPQVNGWIVKNWFFNYYEGEARDRKLNLEPTEYFGVNQGNVEKVQWEAEKKADFDKKSPIVITLAIPNGHYYVYARNHRAAIPEPNLVVDRTKGSIPKGFLVKMLESGAEVNVVPQYEQAPARALSLVDLRPHFSLLDFSVGTNKETMGLEGSVGGRMFQRFGRNLALQTQGSFEFRQQRDWLDLNRLVPAAFIPREQRGLTDYSSRECQFDVGPVMRFGPAQIAVMQSLRYVKRSTFDKGGTIGQFFFNAGFLFKRGQIGVFATRADLDEPVVKTVQFDQVFFEETYLKVTDQIGMNFQVSVPKISGYVEGTIGYLKTYQGKGVPGGTLRYVRPTPWFGKKLSLTVEVGYNESFIKSTGNSLRVAGGVRFGKWLPLTPFVEENGPVPVMVPAIRYETLTRVVRRGNLKPIANAGQDQLNVDWRKGDVVLDGSKSYDPDGDTLSFSWRRINGPLPTFEDAATAHPHFAAKNGEEYVFGLTVTDTYGLKSDEDTVRVTTLRIEQPVVKTFTVTPSTIYKTGDCQPNSATLAWEVTNQDPASAFTIVITNVGSGLPPNGQRTVSPDMTTTYTLTACNVVNECVSATVTLAVKPCGPTITTFTADPPEILAGKSSTLTWKVANADRVTLTNGTNGTPVPVGLEGNRTVTPPQTTVYTLTACNVASECVSANVTVTVKSLPTIVSFKADPPEILAGKSSTLSWKVTNANRVTLTNGADGSTNSVDSEVPRHPVTPTKTTVYTLTACNAASECVSASVTVTVKSLPTIVTFRADPPEILVGQSSTLSWKVDNADRVTLTNGTNGNSVVVRAVVDRYPVSPRKTTIYTLTACSAAGECVSANVTVTVKSLPRIVSFTANPPEIAPYQSVTLSWTVENADVVTLTNYTPNQVDNRGGSVRVTPSKTTIYTLTACSAAGECVSASVTVTVYGPPYITYLTANPTDIRKGECSLLTWQAENASKVTLYANTGDVWDVTGLPSKTVCPLQTTSYYLFACNFLGQCVTSNPVTVTVR